MHVRRSMLATTAVAALVVTGCGSSDSSSRPEVAPTGPTTSAGAVSGADRPSPTPSTDDTSGSVAPTGSEPGPDIPARPQKQTRVLDSLEGSAGPGCVKVGRGGDVRSGAVAVGNFAAARAAYADAADTMEQPEVHFYVIPEHVRGTAKGATLTLTPTSGGPSRTVEVRAVQSADVWKYYAVDITVPGPGSYRLTAEAGTDRGCFVVAFATS